MELTIGHSWFLHATYSSSHDFLPETVFIQKTEEINLNSTYLGKPSYKSICHFFDWSCRLWLSPMLEPSSPICYDLVKR